MRKGDETAPFTPSTQPAYHPYRTVSVQSIVAKKRMRSLSPSAWPRARLEPAPDSQARAFPLCCLGRQVSVGAWVSL